MPFGIERANSKEYEPMGKGKQGNWRRLVIVWLFMLFYLGCTAANVLDYYRQACSGNFDYYGSYLMRASIINFPMRLADEVLNLSSLALPDCDTTALPQLAGESVIAIVSTEIILVDLVGGTCFWLLVGFVIIAFLERRH